jgi:hypothetical protein
MISLHASLFLKDKIDGDGDVAALCGQWCDNSVGGNTVGAN